MHDLIELFTHSVVAKIIVLLFIALIMWWGFLHANGASSEALQLWAASYQAIAFVGALAGFAIAKRWGGARSIMGRAILAGAWGLLFQCFGQSSYSFYIYYLNQPVPYPSIGDLGYSGSIFCYLYGAILLARVSGAHISLRNVRSQIASVVIPVILLGSSYAFFLRGYEFDWSQPLKVILDFGYPLGQATYVSMAILAFLLTRNLLGGIMRHPLLVYISALVMQYFADFTFLNQASQGTWYAGGVNDAMYLVSYLIMSVALLYIGHMFYRIQRT